MSIDAVEFHPGYHQNLGTFKNFLSQIIPPPLVKSHFENTIGNPFFENFREWRYHLLMNTIKCGCA